MANLDGLAWQRPPRIPTDLTYNITQYEHYVQAWADWFTPGHEVQEVLPRLLVYMTESAVAAICASAATELLYVLLPPLRASGLFHLARVSTYKNKLSLTYIACDSDSSLWWAATHPVVGDAAAVQEYTRSYHRPSHLCDWEPRCGIKGYLVDIKDGRYVMQLAYGALLRDVVGDVVGDVAGNGAGNGADGLTGRDDHPLCELLTNSMVYSDCWWPIIYEYEKLTNGLTGFLHCAQCGGAWVRGACAYCGLGEDLGQKFGHLCTGHTCAMPSTLVAKLAADGYHKFRHEPLNARKLDHRYWAAGVQSLHGKSSDVRVKRSIKL